MTNQVSTLSAMVNAITRRLEDFFPGYFTEAKHNHYKDFGWPEILLFEQFYCMFRRNGIARAGVNKTILKTWETNPCLLQQERDGSEDIATEETELEAKIRQKFDDIRFWQNVTEADRRSLVGCYAAVIFRFADGKRFSEPVDTVPGELDGLVEIIPAWEGQLKVADWYSDETQENYGQPKMFQFNEASFDNRTQNKRQFEIHPDRVFIWSADGTVYGHSLLEAGYNDLMTMEKVSGAGGEGFWKNAKSAPVLQVAPGARVSDMAKTMGVQEKDVATKINEQVDDFNKGFDKMLLLQGIEAKTLGITMPSPENFFGIALQGFGASVPIPIKILVGSQTGERASTEDANEWNRTNMSRRNNIVVPNIKSIVHRFEQFSILPENDWFVDWEDLTASTLDQKIDRAAKMATVNSTMQASGEIIFTGDEIRETVDLEPLNESDKYRDEPTDPASITKPGNPAQQQPTKVNKP